MEYELIVSNPHPHRLLFEEFELNNEGEYCSRCHLPLNPPAYQCSDSNCNFHIHQSCLHLPSDIDSPFHPQHSLYESNYSRNNFCSACGNSMSLYDSVYKCRECDYFQLDIRCALENKDSSKSSGFCNTNEKYMHFKHPHPLSLRTNGEPGITTKKATVCVMCGCMIQSDDSSFYFCSKSDQCEDIRFHKQCAELPRVWQNSRYHPHPLILLFQPKEEMKTSSSTCNSCRNECVGWVFTCPSCKFFLHLHCLQSYNHTHTFTHMLSNTIAFICTLCGQKCEDQYPWYCDICHTFVHKKCAELPSTLITTEHNRHVLTLNYYFISPDDDHDNGMTTTDEMVCDICGVRMDRKYAGYACSSCNKNNKKFVVHLKCAAETQTNERSDENLVVIPDVYAHLPTTIKPISRIHPHPLTLISIDPDVLIFECDACLQHFNYGVAYRCETCWSTFDVGCATLTNPIKHPNHQHPLYLCKTKLNEDYDYCDGCGKKRDDMTQVFRCSLCKYYLDIKCATLPVEVRNRFDPHPLKLTTFLEDKDGGSEYYCDVCEKGREMGVLYYSCVECKYEAHTRCVVGEFPYVNSAIHKSHKHSLNLATKRFDLVFQCGVCKFFVHSKEKFCNNLTFNNQNLFTRSGIQLYHYLHHPSPKRHSGVSIIIIGPFGDPSLPKMWKEWVFSTITKIFICLDGDGKLVGTRIVYAKNGRQWKWSRLDWDFDYNDKTIEVSFDYPNEYLVSIKGFYSDKRSSTMKITSLTLITNKKTYGPYGDKEDGSRFSSEQYRVKTIGIFFGFGYRSRSIASMGFYGVSTT